MRGLGRARSASDLEATVLRAEAGASPCSSRQIASVRESAAPAAGHRLLPGPARRDPLRPEAARARTRSSSPAGSTPPSRASQKTLPAGVVIEKENFRQADFIDVAIRNVSVALRDGAVLVLVVLFLFLGNLRATAHLGRRDPALPRRRVSSSCPLFGATLNTMTLGGFTIAIGALVDDAIIDVENVFRRLRQERAQARRRAPSARSTWSSGPRPRCGAPSSSRR